MAVLALSESYRPGALIAGKYRLIKRIGSGAMGAVWSGVNLSTNGQVALKLIERSEPELRHRLLREARSCASIRHKNVVQVHDTGETESGDPFLVMELLQGQTLAALLHERRRLPPDEVALIGREIARGLTAAHEQGIIHRDLKPANIFLHEQPGEPAPVVKILDFGVSKNNGVSDGLRTVDGGAVGSPMYMSPEGTKAERDIDARADVWSLGVVLYEMLTGERPFTGETAEVVFRITHGEIPRVSRRLRRIDPDLDNIVAGCLTRDRESRIASARIIADRLAPHTVPAARAQLPSLMEVGLADQAPISLGSAASGGAALSPGSGPSGLVPHSPGLGSTGLEASGSPHAAVSRSGSRPLYPSRSHSGGLVDQEAATQMVDLSQLAPQPPPPAAAGDAEKYGPRGTIRIDPAAVQAAIEAKQAQTGRGRQGTQPLLPSPEPSPEPPAPRLMPATVTVPTMPLPTPPPPALPLSANAPPAIDSAIAAPSHQNATAPPRAPAHLPVAQDVAKPKSPWIWFVPLVTLLVVTAVAFAIWRLKSRPAAPQTDPVSSAAPNPSSAPQTPSAPPAVPEPAPTSAPSAPPAVPEPAPTSAPAPSAVPSQAVAPTPAKAPATTSPRPSTTAAPRPSAPPAATPQAKPCKSKFGVGCK